MHPNLTLLEQQKDLQSVTPVGSSYSVYQVQQRVQNNEWVNRVIKVYANAQNFYALKLQKQFLQASAAEPAIASLVEVRKVGMHYLFIFETFGKQNLISKVAKKGPLSAKKAKAFLQSGLQVLKQLQTKRALHNRIQPSHWMLKKKTAQLVGWRHLQDAGSGYDQEKLPTDYESLLYKAPEAWDAQASIASEVYSLGLCVYFALTGEHLVEALWQETGRLKKRGIMDATSRTVMQSGFLPRSERPSAWQIGWLKQPLSFPHTMSLKTSWENLLRWMLDPNPKNRPTVEQLQAWLADDEMIQSVVLAKPQALQAPESWQENAVKTAMADTHKLLAIFDHAQSAYQSGEVDFAFNLFENCVFKNHSQSEVKIGQMYERGEPVSQSYALAATMYYQAFCKGNPQGAFLLAKLLQQGQGVPQNLKHAEILYRFAAMRGWLPAQVALGSFYAQNDQTLELARFWLVLAVQNGAIEAQSSLSEVLEKLLERDASGMQAASSLQINLLDEEIETSPLQVPEAGASLLPLSQLIDPEKVLQSAQGLEARMERLIDQLPL